MRITWTIEKKRGNHRPTLTYEIVLDEHELDLAMPPVRVESSIEEPTASWQGHCHPGENERSGSPCAKRYFLETPGHKSRKCSASLRLPWRDDNEYPEVEESLAALRAAFEEQLALSHASEPMSQRGELRGTLASRRGVAASALAGQMLRLAG
ncbi:hypothetical protein [Fundidesulfovibrio putealis]|uniref:hypothetical protein n=1 Tax=Fundidesulfovibrio putealis TaxID=270496 RepID=UPI0004170671|nr:hypothetical protein [Fundidesulfovibrio putealis]